ncbi:alpha/beta fold hydrolase [Streptomyces olindensis]|uniref:alpha/beta fold hydrolase n=1 Tax=Streptomyces olindensis TaxID=358823 RepID=UPI00367FEF47
MTTHLQDDRAPAAALLSLARALLDTASLTRVVPDRMRVAPVEPLPAGDLRALHGALARVSDALRLPGLDVVPDTGGLSAVELCVSRRLGLDRHSLDGCAGRLENAVEPARAGFPGPAVVVPSYDGVPLRCWARGPVNRPAVAIVNACGMPAGMTAAWVAALSSSYRVVTWESRGLFAADDGTGLGNLGGWSLDVQASDLLAVLDGFGIRRAHALGLCGGAAVALAAAAGSDRITSLSLWHGDYELHGEAPKTAHQQDVAALLAMVARGRRQATEMYRLMRRPATLDGLRPDLAHYLIHPYATPELLYRYGLLNGAIMSADCRRFLVAGQPALVVTSETDTTAHPAGSKFVAARLPRAELRTMPDGDHLTAFDAGPALVALARDFLRGVTAPDRRDT